LSGVVRVRRGLAGNFASRDGNDIANGQGMPFMESASSHKERDGFFFVNLRRFAHDWIRSFTSTSSTIATSKAGPVRVLRWMFHRDFDTLSCELTFSGDNCFELRTIPPFPATGSGLEQFSDLARALQRQCDLEAALIEEGWTLELHESVFA
jgi:hypothetical protein